ncbi:MAG: hypothetical protein QGG48_03135, partial [Desulfatiglandales bacterium]|nr:hypothetical protein [Desulfatiglandales bacterium]
ANPKKITIIKKSLPKKIIFHEENKIEKILTKLYKNKIFLDSLSCSVYYRRNGRSPIPDNKTY